MQPLLFLYFRTFVNGVKRAFSSPMRMIGILFFIGYQLMYVPRLLFSGRAMDSIPMNLPHFQFPPIQVVDAIVFGAFALVSLLFASNLVGVKGSFQAADVDVLFPTPVDPKTVLTLKVMRDIWLSLIMPLILAVFLWRPMKVGWANLFSNLPDPSMANQVLRFAMVAYFLTSIAWVWLGHGAFLMFAKPDVKTDRLRSAAAWAVFLGYIGLGYFVWNSIRGVELPAGLLPLAHSPYVRWPLALAWGATNLTMAPLVGNWTPAVVGGGGLLAVVVAAVLFARSRTGWMYESAALRASVTEASIKLRRSGDMYAVAAKRAQARKTSAKSGWLQEQTVRGVWAMLWKDVLVSRRTNLFGNLLMLLISAGMTVSICWFARDVDPKKIGFTLLFLQAMFLIGPALGLAQAGFIESLRRIDLLKPLPFKPQSIVMVEVVSKAAPTLLTILIGAFAESVIRVSLAPFALAGLMVLPAFALCLSAVSLLLAVLLPDVDDPTQRSFRGLATMLGIFACLGPPTAIFGLLVWLKAPVLLAAAPTALVTLGLGWAVTFFAGRVFQDFNPSE